MRPGQGPKYVYIYVNTYLHEQIKTECKQHNEYTEFVYLKSINLHKKLKLSHIICLGIFHKVTSYISQKQLLKQCVYLTHL